MRNLQNKTTQRRYIQQSFWMIKKIKNQKKIIVVKIYLNVILNKA